MKTWAVFESRMPGWAPPPAIRQERVQVALPDVKTAGRGVGTLTPLAKRHDMHAAVNELAKDFAKKIPLGGTTTSVGTPNSHHSNNSGSSRGTPNYRGSLRPRSNGTSPMGLTTALVAEVAGSSQFANQFASSINSFDDSFASTGPNGLPLGPELHFGSDDLDDDDLE